MDEARELIPRATEIPWIKNDCYRKKKVKP